MAGMTNNGWEHRRLPEVIASLNTRADTLFRPLLKDPNDVVDVSEDSMLGRFIQLLAPELASLWEAGLDSYSGLDVDQAYGRGLDSLVAYAAIVRRQAVKSTVDLELGGLANTSIPSRSLVKDLTTGLSWVMPRGATLTPEDASEITFKIDTLEVGREYTIQASLINETIVITHTATSGESEEDIYNALKLSAEVATSSITPSVDVDIDGNSSLVLSMDNKREDVLWSVSNGYIPKVKKIVQAEAEQAGSLSAVVGNISSIDNPVFGWESVTNPFPTVVGYLKETDAELRKRFKDSKSARSGGYADSIFSRVGQVLGVRQVVVYENYTNVVDSIGLPEKSFLVVVLGGDEQEIAREIRATRPVGISSKGNVEVEFRDTQGVTVSERFDRPVQEEVFFKIQYVQTGEVGHGIANRIREALVEYINTQKTIGEILRYDELFNPLLKFSGVSYRLVNFGTDSGNLGYSEVVPPFNGIVYTQNSNIIVEEV